MSRRTETPYKVDGVDEPATRSAVQCSTPEINGPVVPRQFALLLRETCKGDPLETAGAVVSNGRRALAGVSRGRSTEGNEPGNTGGPHNSGRAELGRQNTTIGGLVPERGSRRAEHWAAIIVAEKEWLLYPLGLHGTAGRGPGCPVVWEAGGEIPPPTRLARMFMSQRF